MKVEMKTWSWGWLSHIHNTHTTIIIMCSFHSMKSFWHLSALALALTHRRISLATVYIDYIPYIIIIINGTYYVVWFGWIIHKAAVESLPHTLTSVTNRFHMSSAAPDACHVSIISIRWHRMGCLVRACWGNGVNRYYKVYDCVCSGCACLSHFTNLLIRKWMRICAIPLLGPRNAETIINGCSLMRLYTSCAPNRKALIYIIYTDDCYCLIAIFIWGSLLASINLTRLWQTRQMRMPFHKWNKLPVSLLFILRKHSYSQYVRVRLLIQSPLITPRKSYSTHNFSQTSWWMSRTRTKLLIISCSESLWSFSSTLAWQCHTETRIHRLQSIWWLMVNTTMVCNNWLHAYVYAYACWLFSIVYNN